MNPNLVQTLSLIGAGLILSGYGGQQYAGLRSNGLAYGLLNLIGSALLAASALDPLNAGVLVLESAWAVISLGIVLRASTRRRGQPPVPDSSPSGDR